MLRAVGITHPDFGRAFPCECKREEIEARRLAMLDREDGLSEHERSYRLDGARGASSKIMVATELARLISQERPAGLATLTGDYGVGKSYLMIAAVNAAKERGIAAHYTTMRDLLQYLRKAFNPNNGDLSFDERWEMLMSVPVLAIDELDKANSTAWALEQFSALVDRRWRDMRTKLTLFAMNAPMTVLPGDVRDRLEDQRGQVFTLVGDSMRAFDF